MICSYSHLRHLCAGRPAPRRVERESPHRRYSGLCSCDGAARTSWMERAFRASGAQHPRAVARHRQRYRVGTGPGDGPVRARRRGPRQRSAASWNGRRGGGGRPRSWKLAAVTCGPRQLRHGCDLTRAAAGDGRRTRGRKHGHDAAGRAQLAVDRAPRSGPHDRRRRPCDGARLGHLMAAAAVEVQDHEPLGCEPDEEATRYGHVVPVVVVAHHIRRDLPSVRVPGHKALVVEAPPPGPRTA